MSPRTIPHLIRRARDIDSANRRAVFVKLEAERQPISAFSLDEREELIGRGLRDREAAVRKAACHLVASWLAQCDHDLVRLLASFDVLERTAMAENALLSLFENQPAITSTVNCSEASGFWATLTPESAVLARVFAAHCRGKDVDDAALPVLTAVAYQVETAFDALVRSVQMIAESGGEASDEEAAEIHSRSFVLGQLLDLAGLMDYTDESGRRKMFALVRRMFADEAVPVAIVPQILDVLRQLSATEREYVQVVVEAVQTLREETLARPDGLDESDEDADEIIAEALTSATPVRRAANLQKPEALDPSKLEHHQRCLVIVRALLERIEGSLQEHAEITGLFNELIVPSVHMEDATVREHGLVCLALVLLLDRKTARDMFGFFVNQLGATDVSTAIRVRVRQALFDLLLRFGVDFLEDRNQSTAKVMSFLLVLLDGEKEPAVATTVAVGLCKLLLSGLVRDHDASVDAVGKLVEIYFSADAVANAELRQCLAYFLPVYCYSAPSHQLAMRDVRRHTSVPERP